MGLLLALALGVDLTADQRRCLDMTFLPRPGSPVVLSELKRDMRTSSPAGPTVWPSADFLPPVTVLRQVRTAGVRFTVLPIGRATDCKAVVSSGDAALDARSCDLTVRHLRTVPAVVDGKPVASERELAFRWEPRAAGSPVGGCESDGGTLPIEPLAWAPSGDVLNGRRLKKNVNTLVRLTFNSGGRAQACTVVATTAPADVAAVLCEVAVRNAVVLPAVNEHGDAVPATVTRLIRTRVKPDYATLPLVID